MATATKPRTRTKSDRQNERTSSAARRPALVNPAHFLVATRDSGYKTTALAVAELIDNSLQAGACRVGVEVVAVDDAAFPIEVRVTDDGAGMDAALLADALTFGGSSRFGDRSSLGRYGMGLPNGALSRARRVEVYSWRGKVVGSPAAPGARCDRARRRPGQWRAVVRCWGRGHGSQGRTVPAPARRTPSLRAKRGAGPSRCCDG